MTEFFKGWRRSSVRIAVGAISAAMAYWVISVYATHQREQRIARIIDANRGHVSFEYFGMGVIPSSIEARMSLRRIKYVSLEYMQTDWLPYDGPQKLDQEIR